MNAGISQFEREIREQPESLTRLLDQGREPIEQVADHIRRFNPQSIMVAARGSSDNAARYAGYLLGARNRLPVGLAIPSLFTLYHAPPRLTGSLVIGISQSGQSPDIVAVVEEGHRQGALTVAITNDPTSPLAQVAAHCLPLLAGDEQAIAATKTYTNQLLVLAMLSAALEEALTPWAELAKLPGQVETTLQLNADAAPLAARFRYAEHFVVVGRGFNYATTFEVALKIKETSYVIAEPYSSADFRHGPIAMVDEDFPVVLVTPSGDAYADVVALLDVLEARGAEVVAISDRREVLDRVRVPLRLPQGVAEWLSPVVSVVPGQLWALALAQERGLNPDQPRGLNKVTHTR